MIKRIKKIYAYRAMIHSLVKRDLKGRYKGSVLGFLWTFLNPLLQLLVYTLVFSVIMRFGVEDYYMFLFVALIPWLFFSMSVSGGSCCILQQQDLVKKIYFPREVLPISYVTSQFVNMLLSFLVIFLVMLVGGYTFNPVAILCLPIVMIVEYIMSLGFVMTLCGITVYFRDLEYLLGIMMMAWQFLTPVLYSIDQIPEQYQWVFYLNPMTSVIEVYRDILYYAQVPQLSTLLSAAGIGILMFAIGWIVFDKLQRHFIEEL